MSLPAAPSCAMRLRFTPSTNRSGHTARGAALVQCIGIADDDYAGFEDAVAAVDADKARIETPSPTPAIDSWRALAASRRRMVRPARRSRRCRPRPSVIVRALGEAASPRPFARAPASARSASTGRALSLGGRPLGRAGDAPGPRRPVARRAARRRVAPHARAAFYQCGAPMSAPSAARAAARGARGCCRRSRSRAPPRRAAGDRRGAVEAGRAALPPPSLCSIGARRVRPAGGTCCARACTSSRAGTATP